MGLKMIGSIIAIGVIGLVGFGIYYYIKNRKRDEWLWVGPGADPFGPGPNARPVAEEEEVTEEEEEDSDAQEEDEESIDDWRQEEEE